jgi:hypothetical protein
MVGGDFLGTPGKRLKIDETRYRGEERSDDSAGHRPEGNIPPYGSASRVKDDVRNQGKNPESDRKDDKHGVKRMFGDTGWTSHYDHLLLF